MSAKIWILFTFISLYAILEISMGIRQKRKSRVEHSGDRLSIGLMFTGISLGYSLAFLASSLKAGKLAAGDLFFFLGLGMALAGVIFRIYAIRILNEFFTYTVSKTQDHQLVEKGPYRFIRHPAYLGQLIIFLGVSVALSNWLSVLGMMIPVIVVYGYRIYTEEKFMSEFMGDPYIAYCQRTKRLIPGIF